MPIDLTGQQFGNWHVLSYAGNYYWNCRCQCGTDKLIYGGSLRKGRSKSCGCRPRPKTTYRHGRALEKSGIYTTWTNMLTRCRNPNYYQYANYGGRGISVCERWLDFRNFLADMGEPLPRLTLDRIDNDGHYEPGNCRWATPRTQRLNQRRMFLKVFKESA